MKLAPQSRGFTLVELAVVLVVISLVLVGVLQGTGLIGGAKATNAIATAKDLSAAARQFKDRYRYWPGDLPNAATSLANLPAGCDFPTTTAGIGDGQINTAGEIGCAVEMLFQAGLVKADRDATSGLHVLVVDNRAVRLISAASSNVTNFPPGSIVVEFANLPCEAVQTIDRKIDDGEIASTTVGRAKSSVASCVPGTSNDPVPFYAFAI